MPRQVRPALKPPLGEFNPSAQHLIISVLICWWDFVARLGRPGLSDAEAGTVAALEGRRVSQFFERDRIPVDVDLGHIDHVERSPCHLALPSTSNH